MTETDPGFDGYWWRAEVRHFSVADEWGDHYRTGSKVEWTRFDVVKTTPKGVWLKPYFGPPTFVRGTATRQLACPTRLTALRDAMARKERHIAGCQARLKQAIDDRLLLERELDMTFKPRR